MSELKLVLAEREHVPKGEERRRSRHERARRGRNVEHRRRTKPGTAAE